jgi:hypothetical protein
MFTFDIRLLKHYKLSLPEYRPVSAWKNLTIHRVRRSVEPTQCGEFNPNKGSVGDIYMIPYLKHGELIAESKFQPYPASLSLLEIESTTGAVPNE